MNILRLLCSARGADSESHRLSDQLLEHLSRRHAGTPITVTDFHTNTLLHVDGGYARALAAPADPDGTAAGALAVSDRLIAALRAADVLVIATPMHNFTVPSALKSWIDHVLRVRHTFRIEPQGKIGTLADRPVYVAVSSGGLFSGPLARQPDFLTPYLRHALATMGLMQVQVFSVEGTARGPELLEAARTHGQDQLRAHFNA